MTQSMLSEHVDGVLDPATERELRSHIDSCPACKHELEAIRHAIDLVHSLPEIEPPADMLERVHRKLAASERATLSTRTARFFLMPQVRLALAASLVLAVCIYGYNHYGSARNETVETLAPVSLNEAPAGAESDRRIDAAPADDIAMADKADLQKSAIASKRMRITAPAEKPVVDELRSEAALTAKLSPEPAPAAAPEPKPLMEGAAAVMAPATLDASSMPAAPKAAGERKEINGDVWGDSVAKREAESVAEGSVSARAADTAAYSRKLPGKDLAGGQMLDQAPAAAPAMVGSEEAARPAESKARDTGAATVVASISALNTETVRQVLEKYRVQKDMTVSRMVSKESYSDAGASNVVRVVVLQEKMPELLGELRELGTVTMGRWPAEMRDKVVTFVITVEQAPEPAETNQ